MPSYSYPKTDHSDSGNWTLVSEATFWENVDDHNGLADDDDSYVTAEDDTADMTFRVALETITDPTVDSNFYYHLRYKPMGIPDSTTLTIRLYESSTLISELTINPSVDEEYADYTAEFPSLDIADIADFGALFLEFEGAIMGDRGREHRVTQLYLEVPDFGGKPHSQEVLVIC